MAGEAAGGASSAAPWMQMVELFSNRLDKDRADYNNAKVAQDTALGLKRAGLQLGAINQDVGAAMTHARQPLAGAVHSLNDFNAGMMGDPYLEDVRLMSQNLPQVTAHREIQKDRFKG